jgi:glycosyltransferase involved in cell wall biosynthesis
LVQDKLKKICLVLTVEFAVRAFMVEHLKKLSQAFDVSLIVNTKNPNLLSDLGIKGHLIPLHIAREISIKRDMVALFKLISIFRVNQYDAVHTLTPKAGLLAITAAFVCGISYRVHTFTGQVWASSSSIKRYLLKFLDQIIALLSTHIIIDSPSQIDFLLKEHIVKKRKCYVFGKGSVSGVNLEKFKHDAVLQQKIRAEMNVANSDVLFLFLGRLNLDKGLMDLAQAFIKANLKNAKLLFVGPDEHNIKTKIQNLNDFNNSLIQFVDYTDRPQDFMMAADVLCLPSYREGFGSVIIEAAACGTPALASRIYGITDAIVENETGLLHEPKNVDDIAKKLQYLVENPDARERLGKNAYKRAVKDFDSKLITQAWFDFYKDLLQ